VPAAEQAGRPLYTQLNAWLFRLGVDVVHGRPYHPETQGKAERFHRSLNEEVLNQSGYQALPECQTEFDQWRKTYNLKRPHEALSTEAGQMEVPASHYQPSGRPFPETLPDVSYPATDQVRLVSTRGQIRFAGNQFYIGEAFADHPVALRRKEPDRLEGAGPENEKRSGESSFPEWEVYFCHKKVRMIESEVPYR